MESNWAEENLQTIRTLMERSAIYRRALAPVMIYVGVVGTVAAVAGCRLKWERPPDFIAYWLGIAAVAMIGAFLLVRRQALQSGEPFWSPPTRRIFQALLPAFTAGLVISIVFLIEASRPEGSQPPSNGTSADIVWFPICCLYLYGCAVHAAGFFTPRGLRWFGWFFIIGGSLALLYVLHQDTHLRNDIGYVLMGGFFGLSHLAYGIYLYFTEPRKNEA